MTKTLFDQVMAAKAAEPIDSEGSGELWIGCDNF